MMVLVLGLRLIKKKEKKKKTEISIALRIVPGRHITAVLSKLWEIEHLHFLVLFYFYFTAEDKERDR